MTIDFKTNIKLPYVDSTNALELLETVVDNGQIRLALEVLMDVLVAIVDKVEELDNTVSAIVEALSEEDDEVQPTEQDQPKVEQPKIEEPKLEEPIKQEPKVAQKVKVEEKKVDIEAK